MKNILWLMVLTMTTTMGCSTNPGLRTESEKVFGKLSQGDGKVIGNVGLTLQPLDNGFVTTFQVAGDGTFQGEAIPGKYAYFIAKSTAKNADQALKKIDSQYLEANMSRTVVVEPGKELSLVLQ